MNDETHFPPELYSLNNPSGSQPTVFYFKESNAFLHPNPDRPHMSKCWERIQISVSKLITIRSYIFEFLYQGFNQQFFAYTFEINFLK